MRREQIGELLSAYLDGELDVEETAVVERLLRDDEAAREQLAVLRRTVELVQSLPRHDAPGALAEDLQARFERSELLAGFGEPEPDASRARSPMPAILSMAAMLAIVAGGLWFMALSGGADRPGENKLALVTEAEELAEDRLPGEFDDAGPVGLSGGSRVDSPASVSRLKTEDRRSQLLASATLDQKLASGMKLESARGHAFKNEPLRLRIKAGDEGAARLVSERLLSRLAKMGATDVAKVGSLKSVDGQGPESFFIQGISHRNFGEGAGTQILVRASRRQFDELLREIGRIGRKVSSISFASGPLVVRGLREVRVALGRFARPTTRRGGGAAPPRAGSMVASADVEESMKELAEVLGVEPGVLSSAGSPRKVVAGVPVKGASRSDGEHEVKGLTHRKRARSRAIRNKPPSVVSSKALVANSDEKHSRRAAGRSDLGAVSGRDASLTDDGSYITIVIEITRGNTRPLNALRRGNRDPKSRGKAAELDPVE